MKIEKRYLNAALEVANFKKGKEILQCIHLTQGGHLQATDSFMLIDIDLGCSFERDMSFKADKDLIALLSADGATIEQSDKAITIKTEKKSSIVALYADEYPDFSKILARLSHGEQGEIMLSDYVVNKVLKVSKALDAGGFTLLMPNSAMKAFAIDFHDKQVRFIATPCRTRKED